MLTVIIMPFGNLDVKNIVIKVLDGLEVLCKHSLKLIQVLGVFWTLGTSKHWHNLLSALPCKLKLSLTDLIQVFASLNESFIFCKDSLICVELPTLS